MQLGEPFIPVVLIEDDDLEEQQPLVESSDYFSGRNLAYFCECCGRTWGRVLLLDADGAQPFWQARNVPCSKCYKYGGILSTETARWTHWGKMRFGREVFLREVRLMEAWNIE